VPEGRCRVLSIAPCNSFYCTTPRPRTRKTTSPSPLNNTPFDLFLLAAGQILDRLLVELQLSDLDATFFLSGLTFGDHLFGSFRVISGEGLHHNYGSVKAFGWLETNCHCTHSAWNRLSGIVGPPLIDIKADYLCRPRSRGKHIGYITIHVTKHLRPPISGCLFLASLRTFGSPQRTLFATCSTHPRWT